MIRNMTINFEQEISERMKERANLEGQIFNLQQKIKDLSK